MRPALLRVSIIAALVAAALLLLRTDRVASFRVFFAIKDQFQQITGLGPERLARATVLSGFEALAENAGQDTGGGCPSVVFAGHVYTKNGHDLAPKPVFPDPEDALSRLLDFLRTDNAERMVFGGDSAWSPSVAELGRLLALKERVPGARYVLGNHDSFYGTPQSEAAALHRAVFPQPFAVETVKGVRLLYLRSLRADGSLGLSDPQMAFLRDMAGLRVVAGVDAPGYAVAFLHHALWAGDQAAANRDYDDAAGLRRVWRDEVLPLLKRAGVKLVVAGDGGFRAPGAIETLLEIPHVISGWPAYRTDIPIEWIRIGLCPAAPHMTRLRLIDGLLYREVPPG